MSSFPSLSVIIPFYNEEDNVDFVLGEIVDVLDDGDRDWEIIAVDDGSTDRTGGLLAAAAGRIPRLRVLSHSRNLGKDAAFWYAFKISRGVCLVTLDGDGQNDFRDVPAMLEMLDGCEAVFGQRTKREDPIQKLIASRIGFFFRRLVLADDVEDTACGLKVLKRTALAAILPVEGFHRFIPFMLRQAGCPYKTKSVHHRPRRAGKTKFSLRRGYFLRTVMDLFFMWWYKKNNLLRGTFT